MSSDGKPTPQKRGWFEGGVHPIVFPSAAMLIVLFVIFSVTFPARAMSWFKMFQAEITANFAWLYIVSMSIFLVLAIYLCFSRFGNIKLGRNDDKPQFGTLTWFAMLYSAGMGIGMLFWGVAEPLYHFDNPAPTGSAGNTLDAASDAMAITMAHWGFHAWSLYALVALALAYFGFRRGLPLSFRSVFYPIFGNRIHGRLGDAIDIMAVLATLFGLATSLGLGAKQVNAGLYYVFGLPQGSIIQVIIIACITAAAVASLVSGLEVGIRRLSEFNMGIAALLLLFLFIAGPTVYLLNALVENAGQYVQFLPTTSSWTAAYDGGDSSSWFGNWTVFYWGWWIAWSPFVGMFIARVSRGRTIREFVTGTLLVPTGVALIWLTGFGNSALHQEIAPQLATEQVKEAARQQYAANHNGQLPQNKEQLNAAIQRYWNYQPRQRTVKDMASLQLADGQSLSLSKPAQGDFFLAAQIKGRATPKYVKVIDNNGQLETTGGVPVQYNDYNVMVRRDTGSMYYPPASEVYTGPFAVSKPSLGLLGYLNSPVTTDTGDAEIETVATVMFRMLEAYPLTWLTALMGTTSVILFFITSSDSASLVADIIASGGNQDPPLGSRLFWGILEGALAATLLLAGGLEALQTGSITLGLPFCVIVLIMAYALMRGLAAEKRGDIPEAQQQYIRGEREALPEPGSEQDKQEKALAGV
jgi:choline/carnitine/betaine transport